MLVLTGPTAAGKKEVGLEVARRLDADVLTLDAVKVFRGLDVGAAKPSADDARGVRLHLMGVASPERRFSLGDYLALAKRTVEDVHATGGIALFLGGTPLYLRGLLRGLFDAPPADAALRERLEAEAAADGADGVLRLHERLARVDPDAAAAILPRDRKRIVRALEVHELTGRPISELQRERTRRPIDAPFCVVGLRADRTLLERRIRERVDRMLERGLVAETRGLIERGALRGEAAVAIGYREVAAHLRGECTLDEARGRIVVATRRLVRKQVSWFRKFPEIRWVERRADSTTAELADAVLRAFAAEPSP